jgi:hypothetical protein
LVEAETGVVVAEEGGTCDGAAVVAALAETDGAGGLLDALP